MLAPWKKNYDQPRQCLRDKDITLLTKVHLGKGMGFSSSHVWMRELDHEEGWEPKNWCFWTVVLEKTLKSPLDCKEIQPVQLKEISPDCSLEGLMLKLKLPVLWPPDAKNWLIWKDPDAGKDWGKKEKGKTEDEKVGWHHRLNGPGFGWTLGIGDGQGSLVCCGSWDRKELDITEWLNWTGLYMLKTLCKSKWVLGIIEFYGFENDLNSNCVLYKCQRCWNEEI